MEIRMQEFIDNDKKLIEYFKYKSGDKVVAPNKDKYYIFKAQPNRLDVNLSSYVGISAGASHYYAYLSYRPIYISSDSKGKWTSGGWMSGLDISDKLDIRLTRTIVKKDTDNGRFQKHEIGQQTHCFNTRKEICKALSFLSEHFKRKYDFELECKQYNLQAILKVIVTYEI